MKEMAIITNDEFNAMLNDKYLNSRMFVPGTSLSASFFEIKLHFENSSITASQRKAILEYASACASELRRSYKIKEEM